MKNSSGTTEILGIMENTVKNDAPGLLVPNVNEDSVDIYDGLDINSTSNSVGSSPNASRLKESLDLYEEIVTEEQQSRDSTHSELKSRFKAAQNQIKELRRRLEQMEVQNTGLNTENYRLKKNISALLRTARLEVTRKDAEIQRLNQQSEKGRYHHQSRSNNLRDQNVSSHSSTCSYKSRPPPPTTSCALPPPPLPLPSPPRQPTSSSLPLPNSGPRPHPPPPNSSLLPCPPPPPNSSLLPCPPPPPSSSPLPRPPPLPASPPREDLTSSQPFDGSTCRPHRSCIETRASKASSHSHSKSSSRGDCDIPDKQTEHSVRKSSSGSSTRHSESDKHKYKHREEKSQKLSESTDRRHRTGSEPNKESHAPEKSRSHKTDRGTGRRYDSRSCKSRTYLNAEGHHRSERDKSPPPEIFHCSVSSDDKKERSRERRQDKARIPTLDSEHNSAHTSKEGYSRDHRKIKSSDRHVRNSESKDREKSLSNQHAQCYSDSSKERKVDRLSKDHQRKEDRRHEDEINRKQKWSTLPETGRECDKRRSKQLDQVKVRVCNKEIKEKTYEALKRSCNALNITERGSGEENSPNRKLCFMETLNLTLSPIKKHMLPIDAVIDKAPDDESSQPNVEDMCVIDEVNSSELEAGVDDVAVRSPQSTRMHRCDNVKDGLEKDRTKSDATAADKPLQDLPVRTIIIHSQPLDIAENQMSVCLTHKSPESSSLKAANRDLLINHEDKTKQASDQGEKCVPLEATCGISNIPGSTYEQLLSSSSQNVNRGNNTDKSVAITEHIVLDSTVPPKCRSPKSPVQKGFPGDSSKQGAATSLSRENLGSEDVPGKDNPQSQKNSLTNLPQYCQQGLCPPASSSMHEKDADAVSSTISLESLPQEGLSLPEAIYILIQTSEDTIDSSSITTEPRPSSGCIAVSKVSSTTGEVAPPVKYTEPTVTPKKSFSPGKSHENYSEPSSSMPLFHDEDSMIRTLSNLKRIPDAISPLRSPIRITKRSHLHIHGKPGHIKSLEKDFSGTAVDANSKKLDVNKENKYPGSPANHDMQNLVDKVSDLSTSLSDTELEEGEIISESDEMAAGSPAPATKKAKLAHPVRNKASPNTMLKRTSQERCVASKETNETASMSTRSPKSRFKTVCPAATKASFSTIEEVMDTFKLVRTEIRKKYMKLHKTFPKKSFYGVMDNFQESFLEFVDGANFGQISSQHGELKSTLKKLIASVFSKLSNNGIVRRIFEQQAVDLKQKLWDFVDVQVDYLFRDICTTLNSLCKPTGAEDSRSSGNEKVPRQHPETKLQCQQKEAQLAQTIPNRIKPCGVAPYKTGLGSRGKDIRMTHVEKARNVDPHPTKGLNTQTVVDSIPPKCFPSTPEKNNSSSLLVSQNGSLLDKTDFELLTEQQASSLTFNLVRDTQMGEIFKCLLQGSDLLETSGITGENTAWSIGTPRKDGERFISITTPTKFDSPSKLLSPSKFDTPSKLIATWSSISPRKISSPRSKDQIPLNPALFDESCLLEVPSENRAMLQSSLVSQRSYSILAEDLAVSLTIPSPLKSDSHLSFLQPSSMHIMSTPESVISAHISEDALLDGEDATEQDIHLALDTDNSSCGSSSSVASEALTTPFVFKPDLPMQALVMEKSNDHFIVKICQAATGTDTTLIADESLSQTIIEDQQHREDGIAAQESRDLFDKLQSDTPSNAVPSENNLSNFTERFEICHSATSADIPLTQDENLTLTKDPPCKQQDKSPQQITSDVIFSDDSGKLSQLQKNLSETILSDDSLHNVAQSADKSSGQISQATSRESIPVNSDDSQSQTCTSEENMATQQSPSKSHSPASDNSPHHSAQSSGTNESSKVLALQVLDLERGEMEMLGSESFPIAREDIVSSPAKNQRDCGKGSKRKKHQDKSKSKRSRKEEEESAEEMVSDCKNQNNESNSTSSSLSPSIYAKNVIRKKGEVVISWTRDEDRAILIDLKTKGASRETFSALSEKLNKPSGQIAHRFYQLMKLYKKQEKMDS